MIIVTGAILARPETIEEIARLSLEHVRRSRAEPGCLEHGAQLDAENPLRVTFFERWADAAALKTHFAMPASREFAKMTGRLAASPPSISIYWAEETSAAALAN